MNKLSCPDLFWGCTSTWFGFSLLLHTIPAFSSSAIVFDAFMLIGKASSANNFWTSFTQGRDMAILATIKIPSTGKMHVHCPGWRTTWWVVAHLCKSLLVAVFTCVERACSFVMLVCCAWLLLAIEAARNAAAMYWLEIEACNGCCMWACKGLAEEASKSWKKPAMASHGACNGYSWSLQWLLMEPAMVTHGACNGYSWVLIVLQSEGQGWSAPWCFCKENFFSLGFFGVWNDIFGIS